MKIVSLIQGSTPSMPVHEDHDYILPRHTMPTLHQQ